MYKKHIVGIEGENIASKYLEDLGYKIIERNFMCKTGEIDIVAFDLKKEELVFVEVKTRSNYSYGTPAEAVTNIKQKHIYKTARYYIHLHNLYELYTRIDVIEILLKNNSYKLNHLKQVT